MSLPDDPRTPWPPPELAPVLSDMELYDAWFSGDPSRLANVYFRQAYAPFPSRWKEASFFAKERRHMVHVPLAGDIAATSAMLLFSEHPSITCSSDEAQERLEEIIDATGFFGTLAEAAEIAAALGGVFLKVNWDTSISPYPFVNTAQPDRAVPEWRFGRLVSVTFWQEAAGDGREVWRLLERHTPGLIETALYQGSPEYLGRRRPLDSLPSTSGLRDYIDTGIDELLVRYVPNRLPNRKFRGSPWGASDYSGAETLLATLDEVFTSLLRDIRLGRGRILVPEIFLSKDRGEEWFDSNAEAFVKLNSLPGAGGASQEITVQQFEIRTREHLEAATELVFRIISHSGYSPQTFGMQVSGNAESGTALRMRERKTLLTAGNKSERWRPVLKDLCYLLLAADRLHTGGLADPERPNVTMKDSITTDVAEVARSVEMLHRAQAASIETKVAMVHPDWPAAFIKEEAERIAREQGLTLPDPLQGGLMD